MNNEQIKNILLGIIAILLVIVIVVLPDKLGGGVNNTSQNQPEGDNPLLSEPIPAGEYKDLTYINYDDFEKKLEKGEKAFVMVASPTCIWCQYETPILEHIAFKHDDLEIFYLNIDEFTAEEREKHEKKDPEFSGTPSHYVINKGKIEEILPGARPMEGLLEALTEHKFI